MNFNNLKLQILISGFLYLTSGNVSAQYLRPQMISVGVSSGLLQQKTCISYQYSFARFKSNETKERRNQLFIGVEIGATKFKSNFFVNSSFFGGSFQSYAKGWYTSLIITNVITKPKKRKKGGYKNNYISLKYVFNKFTDVKSYEYDTNNEDDGLTKDEPDIWITDAKSRSMEVYLNFGKHIKLDSYNYLKFEIYGGVRMGYTSGTKHYIEYDNFNMVEYKHKYSYALNPLILGFSLGYQFNFGTLKK